MNVCDHAELDPSGRRVVTFRDFYRLLMEAVNSPENSWYAGEFFHCEPDFFQRWVHFLCHGGLQYIKRKFVVRQ